MNDTALSPNQQIRKAQAKRFFRIRELLEQGRSRDDVAAIVGTTKSCVTRAANAR